MDKTRFQDKIILLMTVFLCFFCLSSLYAARMVRQYYVSLNKYVSEAEELVSKGDYIPALEKYKQASLLYEKKKQEMGVLYCLERMGWLKRELGEYGEALQILQRAHAMGVRLNGDAAEIDSNLGNVYMFSGDSVKAKEHYNLALETLKDFKFKTSYSTSSSPDNRKLVSMFRKCKAIIHARNSLGVLYYFSGEYEQALEHLEIASRLIDRINKVSSNPVYGAYFKLDSDMYNGVGYCETLMGAIYGEMGEFDKAWLHFLSGQEAFKEGKKSFGLLFNRALRFKVEFKIQNSVMDNDKLKECKLFLEEAGNLGATEIVWRTCYEVGRKLIREKKYPQAHDYLARAIETLELTRSRLRQDTVKKIFSASVQDVYALMIDLLFDMGDVEAGFNYLERSKARAFLDILAGRSLRAKKSVDPVLIEKDKEIQEKIETLARRFNAAPGSKDKVLRKQYKELLSQHREILESIRNQSLEFAATTSVATVPLRELKTRLGEETALISYYTGEKRTIIWVVKHNAAAAVPVKAGINEVVSLVRDYRTAIAEQSTERVSKLGIRLYHLLITPVKDEISGTDKLYIVPSGILHYLPFSSLNESQGHLLLQDFIISILPNASSLLFLGKEVTADEDHIIAIGNPERREPGLSLKFAEDEVRTISKNFSESVVLTGKDAGESIFHEENIIDKGIIHIAAHSIYNLQDPLKSALLLAPGGEYDGDLETVEIFSLTMNPRLVVLSACQSGIGEVEGGDEVQSLNRAFLYAGAGAVISSLWNVNDKATAVLMEQFYKNLKGMNKAEALRAAQLQLQKNPGYRNPYYWAAFYLIGD